MSEEGSPASSKPLPLDDATLERIIADPTAAFEEPVLELASDLDFGSPSFQGLLFRLQAAKVKVRDWRKAVKERRQLRERAKKQASREESGEDDQIAALNALLLRDRTTGEPRRTIANLSTILARDPRWRNVVAYHQLRETIVITAAPPWHPDDAPPSTDLGEWSEQDTARAAAWFARVWAIDVPSTLVLEAVDMQAHRRRINPLIDYFRALVWDGVPRLHTWLSTYLGAEQTPYCEQIGARWLISGVARAFKPGCKVDYVIVLEGRQGTGKSTALRTLCPFDDLFFDDELPIGDKEAAQAIRGKFLAELGELSALSRGQIHTIKSFITRQVDTYRPSYARRSKDFPRRCFFAGTTNDEEYLKDDENRRFWPVRTGKIDAQAIKRDRDQLWAEAVHRFFAGEPWYVDSFELAELCRAEQEARAQGDPWEKWIGDWLAEQLKKPCEARLIGDRCGCMRCEGTTTAQVLSGAVGVEKGKQGRLEEMRAAAFLRRCGWKKSKQVMRNGSRIRPYFPPDPPANDPAPPPEPEPAPPPPAPVPPQPPPLPERLPPPTASPDDDVERASIQGEGHGLPAVEARAP